MISTYFCSDSVSKHGHSLRYYELGFEHIFGGGWGLGQDTFQLITTIKVVIVNNY